ncbi:MAG: MOSC domain-containing protein [Pseudomonadota bacterium]
METIATLTRRLSHPGTVAWIGLRPARRAAMVATTEATLTPEGLAGDHARPGKRAVTLVQAEHLPVIAAFCASHLVDPAQLRRNILVQGINLLALRHRHIRIGTAILEVTGPCAPCSRMEEALGHGGYSAVRGHGGVTASVVEPGRLSVGDPIEALAAP